MNHQNDLALLMSIDDQTIIAAMDKIEGNSSALVFFKKTLPAQPCTLAYIYAVHPKCKGLGVIGVFKPVFSFKKMPASRLWAASKHDSLWSYARFDDYFKNCKRGGVAVSIMNLTIFDEVLPLIGTPPRGFAYCKKSDYVLSGS